MKERIYIIQCGRHVSVKTFIGYDHRQKNGNPNNIEILKTAKGYKQDKPHFLYDKIVLLETEPGLAQL